MDFDHEAEPSKRGKRAPERIRTTNLLIRSQMLYPVELRAHKSDLTDETPPKCSSSVLFHTTSRRTTAWSALLYSLRAAVKLWEACSNCSRLLVNKRRRSCKGAREVNHRPGLSSSY